MTVRYPQPRPSHLLGATLIVSLAISLTSQPALAGQLRPADLPAGADAVTGAPAEAGVLARAFDTAATRYGVPRDLLVALGYSETRLDGHAGAPSASGGYGVMHLTSNPKLRTLDEAAALTGLDRDTLRTDSSANVTGAAAVLRSYADAAGFTATQRADVNQWYGQVVRYGGASTPAVARLYADTVYDLIGTGIDAGTADGPVRTTPHKVAPNRGALAGVAPLGSSDGVGIMSTDYGPAAWAPAHSANYTVSSRESSYPINYVVIHVTQGSYAGSISWFQNPASQVSAHYTIRSSDGAVTQSVREKDVAWHAGNWTYNTQSIGIEHEGYVAQASWFTDAMYRSSAALTRHLCDRYGIPKERSRIIGHSQVPGATHTDPGSHWNWTYYMQLVTGTTTPPPTGWTTTVDNSTSGRFTASANWGTSTYSSQKNGVDYRFADPVESSDPAWYKVNIPETASYRVEAWYPDDPGYNSSAPYIIVTPSGNQTVYVDQRSGGGAWRTLGTFTLAAGDANKVGVSRWTGGTGLVIADAIRISRV
ncbi:N-acetylmuramoyl-L-alanine amidase [Plantactinospora sp. S1510]|uniref:N-acetylmuramoyl-L-alanine amidase n=1 Tax=Plantactinospora alkalitolerans TaxID=2789879 RepID=A0ABS0GSB0_9ACTN|nr:N-acetylmuramoyl-L-alanine amidase [Plantactinospora alkalitolerans]